MAELRNPLLDAAFAGLEGRQVCWALLRVPEGGLAHPRGDIDVLIHANDLPAATAILRGLDFALLPHGGRSAHFVHYSPSGDEWLWIHAETEVGFGPRFPLRTLAGAAGLEGTTAVEGVRRLPADTEFWLLMWHCLADKNQVAAHHRAAMLAASSGVDPAGEVASFFAEAAGDPDIPPRLLRAVEQQQWTQLESEAAGLHDARLGSVAPLPLRAVRRASRMLNAVRRLRQRQAVTVAVIGPDGAGKSFLVAGVRATIPLPAVTIYMGLTGGALRYAARLRLTPLVFPVSACIIWGRYLRGRYHAARGRLVIFERYTYDAVAPHPDKLSRGRQLARRLFGRLCPSPDLVLLLDAPGEVLHERSAEYTPETLEDWRQHFRSFAARLPQARVIDATAAPDAVRIEAITRIWRCQSERWITAGAKSGDQFRTGSDQHATGSRT